MWYNTKIKCLGLQKPLLGKYIHKSQTGRKLLWGLFSDDELVPQMQKNSKLNTKTSEFLLMDRDFKETFYKIIFMALELLQTEKYH